MAEQCPWCGEELTPEEIEYPCEGEDENLCERCYFDHYKFTCHWCQEYEDKELECAIGSLFALFEPVRARDPFGVDAPDWYDAENREMKPGIYRVTKWPMYWDAVLDGGLYAESFERVGDLTEEMQRNGGYLDYPTGPLCRECEKKLIESGVIAPPEVLTQQNLLGET